MMATILAKTNQQLVCTILWSLVFFLLFPSGVLGDCTCDTNDQTEQQSNRSETLKYKIGAIISILIAGAIGVTLPQFGRKFEALSPESDIFFVVKAFAAGVILATGFIHILPDAFDNLTSPCLKQNPWGNFPFAGFVAMTASIGTLMVDSFATSFYKRLHQIDDKPQQVMINANIGDQDRFVLVEGHHHHNVHIPIHVHGHGQAQASPGIPSHEKVHMDLIRHRIVSQVLELGIVVHSVIIGVSLGASQSTQTIKPLIAALTFHQFFEGMGLGGCISQAKFKSFSTGIMALFFSLTTPVGIGVGIGISSVYKEDSPTALIVEGILNSAAAGILIYMALVDLLATDFMNPRLQGNVRLQLGANISLLLGAGCMSVLAKWA